MFQNETNGIQKRERAESRFYPVREFERDVQALRSEMLRFAAKRVGWLAEDVVQCALTNAWRSLANFTLPATIPPPYTNNRGATAARRAWLFRILTNECHDAATAQGKQAKRETSAGSFTDDMEDGDGAAFADSRNATTAERYTAFQAFVRSSANTDEAHADIRQRGEALRTLLWQVVEQTHLSETQRIVLVAHLEGDSHRAIALRLELSEQSVRAHLSLAKKTIATSPLLRGGGFGAGKSRPRRAQTSATTGATGSTGAGDEGIHISDGI